MPIQPDTDIASVMVARKTGYQTRSLTHAHRLEDANAH